MEAGQRVWYESGKNYLLPGVICESDRSENKYRVCNEENGQIVLIKYESYLKPRQNIGSNGEKDMVNLLDLHGGAIVYNLRLRYIHSLVYTYIGNILIAVNPYQNFSNFYNAEVITSYQGKPIGEKEAHIFAIANEAYTRLKTSLDSQVILVSGESGSGKTESTKLVTKFLAAIDKSSSNLRQNNLLKQILVTSTLLESFGNAKTLHNDNSSRFAKYLELRFYDEKIVGAKIKEYLLERSRLVYQAEGDRNYHIFYEMFAGMSDAQKQVYGLTEPSYFHYLSQGHLSNFLSSEDGVKFSELLSAFKLMGFNQSEQKSIFSVLTGILHFGNLRVASKSSEDGVKILNHNCLAVVADLWQVHSKTLEQTITYKLIETRRECIRVSLDESEFINSRDGISKSVYSTLFSWLICRINDVVSGQQVSELSTFIALLDIFGFECIPVNSFEQFCINYANEFLQQFFIKHVFKLEQIEYQRERIEWEKIEYSDNQDCIDLFNKKQIGLLAIMDDQCNFPQSTDDTFIEKCLQTHSKSQCFAVEKLHPHAFRIKHYASNVKYIATGFLEKNRDLLRAEVSSMFSSSENKLISVMYKSMHTYDTSRAVGKHGTISRRNKIGTVTRAFQNSLLALVDAMSKSTPFFIRCVKPNAFKLPSTFDGDLVFCQLKYLGILETVTIRKRGFGVRMYFAAFVNRFRCLAESSFKAFRTQVREMCQLILTRKAPNREHDYRLGLNKVFMKEVLEVFLENERLIILERAIRTLQKWWIRTRVHILEKRKHESVVVIQRTWRGRRARLKEKLENQAASVIQDSWRARKIRMQNKIFSTQIFHQKPYVAMTQTDVPLTNQQFNALLDIPSQVVKTLNGKHKTEQKRAVSEIVSVNSEDVLKRKLTLKLPSDIDDYPLELYVKERLNQSNKWGMSLIPIEHSYHNLRISENETAIAVNKLIIRILYTKNMPVDFKKAATNYIIKKGIEHRHLRDEIFIQLASQVYGNSNSTVLKHLWQLMTCCLASFPPSSHLVKHLLKFVSDYAIEGYDELCQRILLSCPTICTHLSRSNVPAQLEWQANERMQPMALTVAVSDNTNFNSQLESWDTAEEFAYHFMKNRGIPRGNCSGWTLTMDMPAQHVQLCGHEFILDAISVLETQYHASSDQKMQPSNDAFVDDKLSELSSVPFYNKLPIDAKNRQDLVQKFTFFSDSLAQVDDTHDGNPDFDINFLVNRIQGIPSNVSNSSDEKLALQSAKPDSRQVKNIVSKFEKQGIFLAGRGLGDVIPAKSLPKSNSQSNDVKTEPAPVNTEAERVKKIMNARVQGVSGSHKEALEKVHKQMLILGPDAEPEIKPVPNLNFNRQTVDTGRAPACSITRAASAVKNLPVKYRPKEVRSPTNEDPSPLHRPTSPINLPVTPELDYPNSTVINCPISPIVSRQPSMNQNDRQRNENHVSSGIKDSTVFKSFQFPKEMMTSSTAATTPTVENKPLIIVQNPLHQFEIAEERNISIAAHHHESESVEVEKNPRVVSSDSKFKQVNSAKRTSQYAEEENISDPPKMDRLDSVVVAQSPDMALAISPQLDFFSVGSSSMKVADLMPGRKIVSKIHHARNSQFLKISRSSCNLAVRKEVFSPSEKFLHQPFRRLLYLQIVRDIFTRDYRSSGFMSEIEKKAILNVLSEEEISSKNCFSREPNDSLVGKVIQIAREFYFYFCRFFHVQFSSVSSTLESSLRPDYIGISHADVKLIARNENEKLQILQKFDYNEFVNITFDDATLKLIFFMKNNLTFHFFSQRGHQIKEIIERFKDDSKEFVLEYVRAVADNITRSVEDLQFRKGDIIKILSYISEAWMIGELNDVSARVPRSKVAPINNYHFNPIESSHALKQMNMPAFEAMSVASSYAASFGKNVASAADVVTGTFLDFACKHFRVAAGANKKSDFNRIIKQASFVNRPIKYSLLNFPPYKNKLAVNCFVCLIRYAGDYPLKNNKTEAECLLSILKICRREVDLIDEVFCQVLKQLNQNRSNKSYGVVRYWRFLAFFAAFVAPSTRLKPYLMTFLSHHRNHTSLSKIATTCIFNANRTQKLQGRKSLPSEDELKAFIDGRSFKRQCIYIPCGKTCNIKISTATITSDAVSDLGQDLKVSSSFLEQCGIAVKMEKDGRIVPLMKDEYLLDIICHLLSQKKLFTITFLRFAWTSRLSKTTSISYPFLQMLFAQLVQSFRNHDLLILSNDASIEIASKLLALDGIANAINFSSLNQNEIRSSIPSFCLQGSLTLTDWVDSIRKYHVEFKHLIGEDIHRKYIEIAQDQFLYGSVVFPATSWILTHGHIAINKNGVIFLRENTKETLLVYQFSEIRDCRSFTKDKMYVEIKHGTETNFTVRQIFSQYAREVVFYIQLYIHLLSN